MTISINTSDYIKTYPAIIDGVELTMREATTSEAIAIAELQEQAKAGKTETAPKMLDIVFSMFDKPEKAKEILGNLPLEALYKVLEQIKLGEDKENG